MWQPHHHHQRLAKGASSRNASDLRAASRSCALTSVWQLAQLLLPRLGAEQLSTQKVFQKLCEPTYSECHRVIHLNKTKLFLNDRACFIVCLLFFCSFLWGPVTLLQRSSLFSRVLSSLEHSAYFSYLLQTVPYLARSHTPFLISSSHPRCDLTRAFLRACSPQRDLSAACAKDIS